MLFYEQTAMRGKKSIFRAGNFEKAEPIKRRLRFFGQYALYFFSHEPRR